MKVCFIGFGSIAKRHILNLWNLCHDNAVELIVDLCRHDNKCGDIDEQYKEIINEMYFDMEKLPDDYDIIFITNPTRNHYDTLVCVQNKAKAFFIEKPVFDAIDDIKVESLEGISGKVCYVACPLRYTSVIEYLKNNVDFSTIYSVRCISSSYLPDWRPDVDYRNTYSAHRDMGGGVTIDLIHEWDYITYLMGFPERTFYISDKISNLEIDSDDIAIYIAKYRDKTVELHLDYFGRSTVRKIELIGCDDTIIGDLISGSIVYLKQGTTVMLKEERNHFQKRELEYFLNIVEGKCPNLNDIANATRVLKLAKGDYK